MTLQATFFFQKVRNLIHYRRETTNDNVAEIL